MDNMNECMWMIMGSIHESKRVTIAKCFDMMEEKNLSKKDMISLIEKTKDELLSIYNEKISSIINGIDSSNFEAED